MEDKYEANNFDENDVNIVQNDNNHGWQKVTYAKRQRKQPIKQLDSGKVLSNGSVVTGGVDNIFQSLEKESEERRRRLEAQRVAIALGSEVQVKSKGRSDDEDDDSDTDAADGANKAADEKKVKQKKLKKPKVTVAEAAAKIDAADLAAFLIDISGSYESQQDIQMMRFADYFGRAFSAVGAAQFPWSKMFRESAIAKIADVPLNHISEAVYKTSVDWINHRSPEALQSFAIWCLDSILSDLSSQNASVKGLKKAVQPTSSKSQVAIFAVLAMILKRKPDVLISILPTLRGNTKYQGQDKLPVIIWMIMQACYGDLSVGFFVWTHYLLPTVSGKSCNPQSRDLILQLVERILSAPKARTVLVNGAIRKGERLLTPADFDVLLHVTFPMPSARVKATERFQAIYPVLKEVALAGPPGSKAMKQASQQMCGFSIKAAGEGNPELAKEATGISIWCLTQNPECFKQWEKLYVDNLEASVSILKKLSEQWKEFSGKQSSFESLKETLKSFRNKNEKALGDDNEEGARVSLFKEADKYSKSILGKLSRGGGCTKGLAFVVIALGVGAVIMSPNIESYDWSKLSAMITSHLQSF
ncbi:transmembrane protein 214-like [Impatiens glandulifera]|uniref:transmembrane protein 214-like n=1 Tax=Impatiens glandulifera TaxID=253017 RepID=UPI001FB0C5AB|nr:transmembrane protein 214-like [Impatiens glandulifera]